MYGIFIAILTQVMLLYGSSAGFNQPGSASSGEYLDRISTETIQKNLNLKPGGLILLDTEFGNVSVEEYSGKEVRVELKLRGTPEGISNFRFTHNFFGNQLTLKGWYENSPASQNPNLRQVEFIIMVPEGSSYAVRAVTKQGNIKASISGSMSGIDLSTEAGCVRIEVPSDISANIDASTSSLGRVDISPANLFLKLCPDCEIRQDDHLKVKMNGGGSSISAYSGIGNVYFEITSPDHESQS